ncbi:LysM peptidoglycan-binding domain-containing protein [Acetivibrio cellulolyticus]|uniref:LysM peptidoglycan-binding domain-containing protein n=1 Tax=Acetivibrio cellulolyticus TaxID=35830 RepID=UPI0001E3055D|nr:LysM peptidoglycan-binding domain-containing protein [Acetivibrio cellulolyticus]
MLRKRAAFFFAAILGVLVLPRVSVYAGGNTVGVIVDNESACTGVYTTVENSTMMIPAKELAESIGASFRYDTGTMTGAVTYKQNELVFRLDNDIVKFNGKYIKAPAPMEIENYRFMVPTEFCYEKLGIECFIDYNKNRVLAFRQTDGKLEYKVRSGDTLWMLSKLFGSTVSQIKLLNGLVSDNINIGQMLEIKQFDIYDNSFMGYTSGNATLSSGPSLNVAPVGYLKPWTEVSVTGKTGTWYNVKTAKGTGYIHSSVTYIKQDILDNNPDSNYFKNEIAVDTSTDYLTYKTYIVQKGDSVWSIAEKMGIPDYELASANNISRQATLYEGDVLQVPVHNVPVKNKVSPESGEILDWFSEAQYVFPIGSVGKVIDVKTGKSFAIKRTMGANHADCETLTSLDSNMMKEIFGGYWNWTRRAFVLEFNGRRFAISIAGMPHAGVDGVPYMQNVSNRSDNYGYGPNYDTISGNGIDGHFDLYFLNGVRHVDNQIDASHQQNILIAGGLR